METLVDIDVVCADDWEAIYLNGNEFLQNHSHDWPYFIERFLVGKTIRSARKRWVRESWAEEEGHFPDLLSEIPKDAWID